MTKKTVYGILLLFLILAACAGAILWLATTEAGARRVGAFLAGRIDAEIEVRKVAGSILDGLALEDVTIRRSPLSVRIKDVRIRWLPLSVFSGWKTVNELSLKGIAIDDDRPEEAAPPDLTWPAVPGVLAAISGSVEALTADDIVYTRLAKPPLFIKRVSGSLSWGRGRLTLKKISIATQTATIGGEATAGFREPTLAVDLAVALAPALGGLKNVNVNIRLVPAKNPEQAAGEMTIVAISTSGRRMELAGGIGLTRSSLNLRKLHLTQSGRKGVITGEGELTFPKGDPFLSLQARLSHLDLVREIRMTTDLSGVLSLTGNPRQFKGNFDLANAGKGWRSARLSGSVAGNAQEVSFPSLEGSWLAGKVKGGLQIALGERISLRGELEGRGLQPSQINPEWSGVANLTLAGELHWSELVPLEGFLRTRLLESSLRGQALTGEATARVSGGGLSRATLALRGRGFDIHASGGIRSRIVYRADIDDLAGLIPGVQGRLHALGWLTLRQGIAAFTAKGSGNSLAAAGAHIDSISFDVSLDAGKERSLRGALKALGLTYGRLKMTSLALTAQGALSRHTASVELRSSQGEISAALSGSYLSGSWQGKIMTLAGRDTFGRWRLQSPVNLRLSETEISLSSMMLQGNGAELMEIKANMAWRPEQGSVRAAWRGINLGRANAWLRDLVLTGVSAGNMEAAWQEGELSRLRTDLDAAGTVTLGERTLAISRAAGKLSWDMQGLIASGEIDLAGGGRFNGRLTASSPVRLAVPENGDIEVEWREIDLSHFRNWFPPVVSLTGRLSGQVKGKLLPGGRPDLAGKASVTGGFISWQREEGLLSATLRQAALSLAWRGERLSGEIEVTLDDYGQARAVYSLPIPARLPPAVNGKGKLSVALKGRLKEKGMFTAAFPGLVEESRGELSFSLNIAGTWEAPVLGGNAEIADAGAYLPDAGIKLRSISLKAHLEGEQVFLDSLRAESGAGHIELTAVVTLRNWKPAVYRGALKGVRFQTIYLPELRVYTNPDLTFTGTPDRLTIRGIVTVPELKALGSQGPAPVMPSKDIIIVDAPREKEKKLPFALDLRVKVVLGDDVTVKVAGVDMKLGGSIDVTAGNPQDIRAKGMIRIVKGTYRAQGINLDITQGRLIFDGPAGSPNLDILAVRKVDDKTVGVLIRGVPASPVIKLYSQPPMADPDIMSYLVLGRSLHGGGDISLLVNAAGLLLSRGESESFLDQLKRNFGLDTLDIEMAREKASVVSPGAATAKGQGGTAAQGNVAQSVVTVGKYLTPKLYISYGRSLFTETNLLRLRYRFSSDWELETQSGIASGADIYYKIEFQ